MYKLLFRYVIAFFAVGFYNLSKLHWTKSCRIKMSRMNEEQMKHSAPQSKTLYISGAFHGFCSRLSDSVDGMVVHRRLLSASCQVTLTVRWGRVENTDSGIRNRNWNRKWNRNRKREATVVKWFCQI